jgi:hypothetical protein
VYLRRHGIAIRCVGTIVIFRSGGGVLDDMKRKRHYHDSFRECTR